MYLLYFHIEVGKSCREGYLKRPYMAKAAVSYCNGYHADNERTIPPNLPLLSLDASLPLICFRRFSKPMRSDVSA